MIPRWCLIALLFVPALRTSAATIRQVDMGVYTVLTNATNERKVKSWVEKFDLQRRAAQQLIGLEDRQILHLTVLLMEQDSDFKILLGDTPGGHPHAGSAPELVVQSVGLARQPMIALSLESGDAGSEAKIRSALAMWLLSSSGVLYDHWVVQGFLHFFQEANIRRGWITVGQSNEQNIEDLRDNRDSFEFDVEKRSLPPAMAWLAVYHLTISKGEWQGMGNLTEYQQRVADGTPLTEAFTQVFGLTPAAASAAMMRRMKSMDFKVARIPSDVRRHETAVVVASARPGLWSLNKARFMVQKPGASQDLAMVLLYEAAAVLPAGDPGPDEVRWLSALGGQQSGLAAESLARAIKLGTVNDAMRLQWSMDTINEGIRMSGGVMVAPEKALLVADMLTAVAANNPRQLLTYRLLADVMPSVTPAREQDRLTLERARETLQADDEVLRLGLVAWRWRNGELSAAGREMKAIEIGPEATPFVKSYANWLQAQLGAEERLTAFRDAITRGGFLEAGAVVNGIQAQFKLVPDLAKSYREARLELDYYDLTVQAQSNIESGRAGAARVLLEDIPLNALSPKLRERVERLIAEARQATAP